MLQFVFEVRRSDAVVSRPTIRVLSGTDANVSLGSEGSQFSITFESVRAQSLIGMRGEVLVDAERHPLSMEFPIGTSTEIPLPGSEFRIWVVATVAKVDA